MRHALIVFYALVWMACGIAATGYYVADSYYNLPLTMSQERGRRALRNRSLVFIGLGGPVALLITMVITDGGHYGWTLSVTGYSANVGADHDE